MLIRYLCMHVEMAPPTPPPPLQCDVETRRKKRHLSSTVRLNKNSYRLW